MVIVHETVHTRLEAVGGGGSDGPDSQTDIFRRGPLGP
jgi:hypothetical protein